MQIDLDLTRPQGRGLRRRRRRPPGRRALRLRPVRHGDPGGRRAAARARRAGSTPCATPRQPAADDTAGLLRLIGPAWLVVDGRRRRPRCASGSRELAGHLHAADHRRGAGRRAAAGDPGRRRARAGPACSPWRRSTALRRADVVFFDRLAPTDDLAELAPGGRAGRRRQVALPPPGRPAPIEELMVDRARRGQRWSGSRAATRSSSAAAARRCRPAWPPASRVRVVPGVSSALAVPASAASRSPTAGVSHAFTVISGHVPPSDARARRPGPARRHHRRS